MLPSSPRLHEGGELARCNHAFYGYYDRFWEKNPKKPKVFVAKRLDALWLVGIAILATFFIKGLANDGQATLMSAVGLRIVADTQNRLFRHLLEMDLAFFAAHRTGALISRLTLARTASIPTPRPDTAVTSLAVEKPAWKMNLPI